MCVYYARADLYQERFSLIPACLSLILSFIAGGRGGFLYIAILTVPLFLTKFYGKQRRLIEKLLLTFILAFILLIAALPLIERMVANTNIDLISNFQNKAKLTDSYRYFFWQEYIESCIKNWRYLLFGARINDMIWASVLEGNLHNSYLFVHAFYGLGGFIFVLVCSAKAIIYSIRNKKWIYLFSLVSFEVRAFTDHLFAANRMSPIFFALLLAPYILEKYNKPDPILGLQFKINNYRRIAQCSTAKNV